MRIYQKINLEVKLKGFTFAFMNEKYYTPEISDLRIGYECEFYDLDDNDWTKITIDNQSKLSNFTGLDILLKTPYLTAEQIETEGWEKYELYNNPNRVPFEKDNYVLILDTRAEIPMVEMIFRDPSKVSDTILNPERFHLLINCPSINEFRTLIKWLGI